MVLWYRVGFLEDIHAHKGRKGYTMANNCKFRIVAPQHIVERLLDSKLMKIVGDGIKNGILFTYDSSIYNNHIMDALIDVSKIHPDETIIISYSDESTLFEVVGYCELTNCTISDLDSDIGKAFFDDYPNVPSVCEGCVGLPSDCEDYPELGVSMESLCFASERDNIENLILGGMDISSILRMFPHYSSAEIEKMVEAVAGYCWLEEKHWRHYRLYSKPLLPMEKTST